MTNQDLVSVIIPAFNAERTLGDTLDSVCNQTHHHLEIIVVDDGSQDRTAEIAEAHAAKDGRIRLIRQENGGVARARNAGAAASRAHYLAPVDADDLWHPKKIAHQLAALRRAGPEAGYAYTYYRRIDAAGRVTHEVGHHVEGAVFLRSLFFNFVGNGSSLLIRRAAFDSVGGYDPVLRDAGLQGCEDLLLQMLIARHWRIVCVPSHLTGYRRLEDAMSSDTVRMMRSHYAALETVARRVPEAPADLVKAAVVMAHTQNALSCCLRLKPGALEMLQEVFAADALAATRESARVVWNYFCRLPEFIKPWQIDDQLYFNHLDPDQRIWARKPLWIAKHLDALAAREEAFFVSTPSSLVPPERPRHERRT